MQIDSMRRFAHALPLLPVLLAGAIVLMPASRNLLTFQDPDGRFQFQYPAAFGAVSQGTDYGMGNRMSAVRFSEFSAGFRSRHIVLGGEAVVNTGFAQLDVQAAGGLYDPITMQVFQGQLASAIRSALPPLTIHNICEVLERDVHLDLNDARLGRLDANQRGMLLRVDQMGNVQPKVIQCNVAGDTVTFHKTAALDSSAPPRHVYGAIRFLPAPYAAFHLIRGGTDTPGGELLRQITAVVNSWKPQVDAK